MIPTLLRHSSSCVDPKLPVRDAHSAGVVVFRCACGAIASTPRSA